jgi:hypothetical protein
MTDTTNTEQAPATSAPEKPAKREQVAVHEFIDAAGAVQENIELATGIKYTDKATGKVFTYQIPDAVAGSPVTMLAVFGAKTKATNSASAARQARLRDSAFTQDDIDYVNGVFADIQPGQWEKPGEGSKREPKYDLDILTGVICDVIKAATGKEQDPAKLREKLETDLKYRRGAVARRDVQDAYAAAVGREDKPADTLLVD